MLYNYEKNSQSNNINLLSSLSNLIKNNNTFYELNVNEDASDEEHLISNYNEYKNIYINAEEKLSEFYKLLSNSLNDSSMELIGEIINSYREYEKELSKFNENEIKLATHSVFSEKYKLALNKKSQKGISNINLEIKSFVDDLDFIYKKENEPEETKKFKFEKLLFNQYKIAKRDSEIKELNFELGLANDSIMKKELYINNDSFKKILTENSHCFFTDFLAKNNKKDRKFKESLKIKAVNDIFNIINKDQIYEKDLVQEFSLFEKKNFNKINSVLLENDHVFDNLIDKFPEKSSFIFNYLLRNEDKTDFERDEHDTYFLKFLESIKTKEQKEALKKNLEMNPLHKILIEFSKDDPNIEEDFVKLGERMYKILDVYKKEYEEIKASDIYELFNDEKINHIVLAKSINHLSWDELNKKVNEKETLVEYIINKTIGTHSTNLNEKDMYLLAKLTEHPEFDHEQKFLIGTSELVKSSYPNPNLYGRFTLTEYMELAEDNLKIQILETSNKEDLNEFIKARENDKFISPIYDKMSVGNLNLNSISKQVQLMNHLNQIDKLKNLTLIDSVYYGFKSLFVSFALNYEKKKTDKVINNYIKAANKEGKIITNAKFEYDENRGESVLKIIKKGETNWTPIGKMGATGVFSDIRLNNNNLNKFKAKNPEQSKLFDIFGNISQSNNHDDFIKNQCFSPLKSQLKELMIQKANEKLSGFQNKEFTQDKEVNQNNGGNQYNKKFQSKGKNFKKLQNKQKNDYSIGD